MTTIQNRIIGYRVIKASELAAHPDNWRKHPAAQEAALRGVLAQVGWVDTALYNVRTGRIIDGHLRKSIAGEETRRIVYAVELNPAFVAVALERLAGMGLEPCLIEDGV